MKRDLCRYCRKPMANEADCDAFQPGEGEHLCWHILQNCDQDAEQGIDLRDAEIARLERELEQVKTILADPLAVHLNMMLGIIKWTPANLRHLLGDATNEEN